MALKKLFGKKLKEIREALNMSQETFSEKIGITRNSLARIENGRNFVSENTLEKISSVLKMDYKELFDFKKKTKNGTKKALEILLSELDEDAAAYFLFCINEYVKIKNDK